MTTPATLHTVHTLHALHTLQHEFARHVTRLGTDGEGLTSASRDSRPAIVEQLRSDRGIAQEARLGVYRHGYFARIHDVLRDDFGALHALFGAAAFHDLAKLYLLAHPPRSHSLRDVGSKLPAFLAGPVAEPFATRWPWAADLASLERALIDVFDAPDRLLLDREALSLLPPAAWGALELELVPAHRILMLEWPVHRLRQAWSNEVPLPALDRSPTTVVVHRHREEVFTRSLGELEQRALALVGAGRDLASICGCAADELGDAGSPSEVLALLERWLADGLLARGESTPCASRDR
jgi:hypothetical protein